MKFPGGLNIQGMMKQAQQMQEKMAREMEELRVDASAGGGVVTVEMKGNHEIISLKIDPEIVKEGDVEMLQDMIAAALNEANFRIDLKRDDFVIAFHLDRKSTRLNSSHQITPNAAF